MSAEPFPASVYWRTESPITMPRYKMSRLAQKVLKNEMDRMRQKKTEGSTK